MITNCSICQSQVISEICNWYRCLSCGHLENNHGLDDVSKWHKESYRDIHPFHDLDIRLGRINRLINVLINFIRNSNSVLEVGCGDGILSRELKKHINIVTCIDIDSKAVLLARSLGLDCIESDIYDFNKGRYDIVISTDLIEHLQHLTLFKQQIINLCNKYLVITTPIKRRLKKFTGHVHAFTRKSMNILFEEDFIEILYHEGNLQELANKHVALFVFKRKLT